MVLWSCTFDIIYGIKNKKIKLVTKTIIEGKVSPMENKFGLIDIY